MSAGLRRDVGCTLGFDFLEPSVLALQIAVTTSPAASLTEQLTVIRSTGEPVTATEVAGAGGARVHIVDAPAGPLTVTYTASTTPSTGGTPQPSSLYDDEVVTALRQSRYCPTDVMAPFARAELIVPGRPAGSDDLAAAAASWVFERIAYVGGSSGPTDTAIDTLLTGTGVCRDFAHLAITMCRSVGVPARLASVYAPGLVQMDFHAVVEVWRNGQWEILDPTRLAPRSSLVRIATGRDAADTAFAATLRGDVELVTSEVFAVVDGSLPADDHGSVVALGFG